MNDVECVPYRTQIGRGIAPLADVYLPARPTTTASVVLVHGGAFVIGSRRMKPMRLLASRLSAAGIAVCAVDYRMVFRGGRLDEAVDDVCAALAFWRARAPDPHAVSIVGLSAGASLGLLAAARAPVAALACCFGLYEIDHLRGPAAMLPRLLVGATPWIDRFAVQPAAPTLILHGDADVLVPVAQAHRLAARRAALALPTKLVIYRDAPHGFFNRPCEARDAALREIIAHVGGAARRDRSAAS